MPATKHPGKPDLPNGTDRSRELWKDPQYREKVVEGLKRHWATTGNRRGRVNKLIRASVERSVRIRIEKVERAAELELRKAQRKAQQEQRVLEVYRTGMRIEDMSTTLGISKAVLFRLLRNANEPKRMTSYSAETKQQVLRAFQNGRTIKSVAQETGISERTLAYWRVEAGLTDPP